VIGKMEEGRWKRENGKWKMEEAISRTGVSPVKIYSLQLEKTNIYH